MSATSGIMQCACTSTTFTRLPPTDTSRCLAAASGGGRLSLRRSQTGRLAKTPVRNQHSSRVPATVFKKSLRFATVSPRSQNLNAVNKLRRSRKSSDGTDPAEPASTLRRA